jgi:hypothetical protein
LLQRFGLAAITASLLASPSAAIVSNPPPRICNEYPHSDYVFSGRVLSHRWSEREQTRDSPSNIYRIRVDRVFKGKVPSIARAYTPADSGGGALDFSQRAIVFAERSEGHIVFSGSSNTASGAEVPKVMRQLRDYLANPPKVATIAGRIDGWLHGPMEPVGSVLLLVTNGRLKHFVRADRAGRFLAEVPPGRWSVQIAEPGWASRSGVYSYDFTMPLRLAKGGCADIELEIARPGDKLVGPDWRRWPDARR